MGKRLLNILNRIIFPPENTNIDVSVFMFDLRMIKGGRDLCVFFTPERYWESWKTKPLMKMGDFDVCNKKKKNNEYHH